MMMMMMMMMRSRTVLWALLLVVCLHVVAVMAVDVDDQLDGNMQAAAADVQVEVEKKADDPLLDTKVDPTTNDDSVPEVENDAATTTTTTTAAAAAADEQLDETIFDKQVFEDRFGDFDSRIEKLGSSQNERVNELQKTILQLSSRAEALEESLRVDKNEFFALKERVEELEKAKLEAEQRADALQRISTQLADDLDKFKAKQNERDQSQTSDWAKWFEIRSQRATKNFGMLLMLIKQKTGDVVVEAKRFYEEYLKEHIGTSVETAKYHWEKTVKPGAIELGTSTKIWIEQTHKEYRPVLEMQIDNLRQWAKEALPTQTQQFHRLITVESVVGIVLLFTLLLLRTLCCGCRSQRHSNKTKMD